MISIHALLAESDNTTQKREAKANEFLSTLSLRRATASNQPERQGRRDFYPRSPCGERRQYCIRARGEFDISIHALLAESDTEVSRSNQTIINFYPRSPCGERRINNVSTIRIANFYPRSPCGERQCKLLEQLSDPTFLSTLSLRRATAADMPERREARISIHALLAESDIGFVQLALKMMKFLSTLSLRRATGNAEAVSKYMIFLSTLSLRRATYLLSVAI